MLPESVTELVHAGTTFYVVGTAHVSQQSVEDVRAVIEEVRPEVVCVELCKSRHDALLAEKPFRSLDLVAVIRAGRGPAVLAQLALAAYQKRIGKKLGVTPGAELLAAVRAAKERGIPVELADREIAITLARAWHALPAVKRVLLTGALIGAAVKAGSITKEAVEELKDKKQMGELLEELAKAMPEIKAPLIDERDQYLASRMVEAGAGKQRVVVVVGAAHVPGITANLGKPIDRAALNEKPRPRSWKKWLVPLAVVALTIASGTVAWAVPTAIGTGFAIMWTGGSPLALVAGMAAAPIAALAEPISPRLSVGHVVGLAEVRWHHPSTVDRDALGEDATTVKGFWKNRITRILLIGMAAGVGARLGLYVGIVRCVTLL